MEAQRRWQTEAAFSEDKSGKGEQSQGKWDRGWWWQDQFTGNSEASAELDWDPGDEEHGRHRLEGLSEKNKTKTCQALATDWIHAPKQDHLSRISLGFPS